MHPDRVDPRHGTDPAILGHSAPTGDFPRGHCQDVTLTMGARSTVGCLAADLGCCFLVVVGVVPGSSRRPLGSDPTCHQ